MPSPAWAAPRTPPCPNPSSCPTPGPTKLKLSPQGRSCIPATQTTRTQTLTGHGNTQPIVSTSSAKPRQSTAQGLAGSKLAWGSAEMQACLITPVSGCTVGW